MNEFAIIGAGTVAQTRYIPALSNNPHASLKWIVDVDRERAKTVAADAGVPGYATDYDDVLSEVDAAVIATPPRFHEEIARDCIRAGVDILSEKPVALSSQQAEAVTTLARDHGRQFAISRQYREAPACRILKSFVSNEAVGPVQTVTARFGDGTHWDFASDYRIDQRLAGGGVLADKGPHLIDIVLWIVDENIRIDRYRDDNFGGMEANAEIEFSVPGMEISGTMEISASRDITNVIEITGETGRMVATPDGTSVTMVSNDMDDRTLVRTEEDSPPKTSQERIARQVDRFVESLDGEAASYVPAETDTQVLQVIESCYSKRERLVNPWEEKHLTFAGGGS